MSKNQSWGGRFAAAPEEMLLQYSESVSYDRVLYAQDIAGSKAHAAMLAEAGVISHEEAALLAKGLNMVLAEIESGQMVWKTGLEDVHMNIEARLTELIGDAGKKLHTGRSRNDQTALDFRLFVSARLGVWSELLKSLVGVFARRAREHAADILPGCTHFQPAQPVSLAQHLLAYSFMFKRDHARIADVQKRVRVSPLGAGALSGVTYPLQPRMVADTLGLEGIFDNSMDAVSDRDFALEALFCASLIIMHLSRFCEEIILWANPAFGFIRLPDAFSTGSSMMPQKKNPDVAELMRGRTGRVYGGLMGLLTTLKGLPLTYNRDLQEDKEPFIDADKTISSSLAIMAAMLEQIKFNPERMRAACKAGFLNATELADYLVATCGVPFREAHHHAGAAVALAEGRGIGLEDLSLGDLKAICPAIENDVYKVLEYATAVARRETSGGTGPGSIEVQLKAITDWLK